MDALDSRVRHRRAKSIPFVVLTSNEERRLGDPIRRRSLYVRVEHPTPEREAEIIASRTPKADETFHREMAGIALSFRNYSLEKPPSVSEMIDFANALQLLGTDHVTEEHRDVLLPFLAKTEKDRRHLLLREGFKSLLDDGARFARSLALPGGPPS
jgi:MoxR-like ATPase